MRGGFSESRGRHWKGLDERWLPADQLTHHPQHPQTTLPHTKLHLGVILRRERLKVKIYPTFWGQAGGRGGGWGGDKLYSLKVCIKP